jgi:FkbM family methyltransferase
MQGLPIEIADGNTVTVPASLNYLSTYVLLEQEDWFEKELPFVRRLLQPGMRVLDIGANYGIYSVAMGRAVGPDGRVWAFEPSRSTFRFLRHTLADNDLNQVGPDDCALSDQAGRGRLTQNTNAELNSLLHGSTPDPGSEEVRIDTLDAAAERRGMERVDFVKLDAEGEEARIVAGGQGFLQSEDPLIMFELKHGDTVNTDLLGRVRESGYRIFRLIGPSEFLVPVENFSAFDGFELNLFACKAGRAAQLEQQGLLVMSTPAAIAGAPGAGIAYLERQAFAAGWPSNKSSRNTELVKALDAYALWCQQGAGAGQRYGALLYSLRRLELAASQDPSMVVLSMLARVAYEAGSRMRALQILGVILNEALRHGVSLPGPTWPASSRYDSVTRSADVASWFIAASAQAMVCGTSFSGYFSGSSVLDLLDVLHASPYANPPMERRRQLQRLQAKRSAWIEPSPLLATEGPEHLNAEFWRQAAADRSTMPAGLVRPID